MDFSSLPKVDKIVQAVEEAEHGYSRVILSEAARDAVAFLRRQLAEQKQEFPSKEDLFQAALAETRTRYRQKQNPSLRRVINATGVVLHTNLGRSVLADAAVKAVVDAASGYCNLELDLESGKRSSRYDHVVELLCELTGAEDALVVNNNAGAVLLLLDELAKNGEAVVSRGQLVEIGGNFRLPDIMERSGVILHEVGTTNRTNLSDYENAINENTKVLMHVHPSNFKIYGFTESVALADMVELGHKYRLTVVHDLGSGCLYPLAAQGIGDEPMISQVVGTGVDVVTFSGDKLLGGPQSGILAGKKEYIKRLKKNPLTRALRVDKLSVAALEATLRIYLEGRAGNDIPTLSMITASAEELRPKAEYLAQLLKERPLPADVQVINTASQAGGGSMPTVELPTCAVEVVPHSVKSADLLLSLRQGTPAALGYIRNEKAIFDVRTLITEKDTAELADLIRFYLEA